jgi:hypothetical protein
LVQLIWSDSHRHATVEEIGDAVAISSTYGFPKVTLAEARKAIENALGLVMEGHESFYMGGDYYFVEANNARVVVRLNLDLVDNIPEEDVEAAGRAFTGRGRDR